MSNRDFSHVTQTQKKAAQTQYATLVANSATQVLIPGFIPKGGVASASTGIATVLSGAQAVGATVAPILMTATSAVVQDTVARNIKTTSSPAYNIAAAIAAGR